MYHVPISLQFVHKAMPAQFVFNLIIYLKIRNSIKLKSCNFVNIGLLVNVREPDDNNSKSSLYLLLVFKIAFSHIIGSVSVRVLRHKGLQASNFGITCTYSVRRQTQVCIKSRNYLIECVSFCFLSSHIVCTFYIFHIITYVNNYGVVYVCLYCKYLL